MSTFKDFWLYQIYSKKEAGGRLIIAHTDTDWRSQEGLRCGRT
jgi:hypothetical protein